MSTGMIIMVMVTLITGAIAFIAAVLWFASIDIEDEDALDLDDHPGRLADDTPEQVVHHGDERTGA